MTERIEDWLSDASQGYGARPRAALESFVAGGGAAPAVPDLAVRVEETPPPGLTLVKADFDEPQIAAALCGALEGCGLSVEAPPTLNQALWSDGRAVLRPDPERLLLRSTRQEAGAAAARIDAALKGHLRLVEDVSDAWAGFRVAGRGVREVLAKGAAIDLHPAAFGWGEVRRTALGAVEAILLPLEGAPESFEALCRRSQGAALHGWLVSAAAAGSLPEAIPSAIE